MAGQSIYHPGPRKADRIAGVWRRLDRRITRCRPEVGGAGSGANLVTAISDRDHQHLVVTGRRSRRVLSPHRKRLSWKVFAGHWDRSFRAHQEYRKPYDALVAYLDTLDGASVPTSRRVLAALGPKVLALSAERSAGAHPYLTTPEHTAQARELVGNSVFLAPEHKVVLTTDATKPAKSAAKPSSSTSA